MIRISRGLKVREDKIYPLLGGPNRDKYDREGQRSIGIDYKLMDP